MFHIGGVNKSQPEFVSRSLEIRRAGRSKHLHYNFPRIDIIGEACASVFELLVFVGCVGWPKDATYLMERFGQPGVFPNLVRKTVSFSSRLSSRLVVAQTCLSQ